MIKIQGKRNHAIVYTDKIDKETKTQLAELLREKAFTDSKIRIMPDTHSGKGCIIGTTMTLSGRVCPALVGVDIGCGMETVIFEKNDINLKELDELIHSKIPSGAKINTESLISDEKIDLSKLRCYSKINAERAYRSIGTLGGGNHFIELDKDDDGFIYLIIHSGSRQLGNDVAKYYQDAAYKYQCKKARKDVRAASYEQRDDEEYYTKSSNREQKSKLSVVYERAILDGELFDDYLHDILIVQKFADINRKKMVEIIESGIGLCEKESFSNIHNYIDNERMILRKGAVSANQGERVIIPLNMRDGALVCTGLGNPDWNFSAPHGAGRICSRTEAKYAYNVEEFKEQMKGVYTTTANINTIDECPMVYKTPESIIEFIGDTVTIDKIIRPVYNFKADN